ncbi:beta-ketoacyl-[acyl-carrier-protein] synthase family protein [Salegentibacter sp. HM20]
MKALYLLDDCIISPLGFSTEENLKAVEQGKSALEPYESASGQSGYAGVIAAEKLKTEFSKIGDPERFTRLEQMMLLAVANVLEKNPGLNPSETGLILSTTKGNIDLLDEPGEFPAKRIYLAELAKVIAGFFGFSQEPVILSNACISGGLALAVARRLCHSQNLKNVFVVGGDICSDFVLSGFHSFQAISTRACMPFSKNRDGISLGEAAAAMLLSTEIVQKGEVVSLIADATANDANHISGPSRTGEGLLKSIENAFAEVKINIGEIGFISAHGTATLYNDEMEAIAFNRAGLGRVPLNSFKGYFGHTLGASALLESIFTKHTLLNKKLYPSPGFEEKGTSKALNIIKEVQYKNITYALKTASGFGGCNLALVFKKEPGKVPVLKDNKEELKLFIEDWVRLKNGLVEHSGQVFFRDDENLSLPKFLKEIYKKLDLDYPKFHKMDGLSKLGFLATEILSEKGKFREDTALIFANSASSLETDREFQESTRSFASPALFVYTLPNIVLGEISIRHKLQSENAFFISEAIDAELLKHYASTVLSSGKASEALCGWLNLENGEYDVFLCRVSSAGNIKFSAENLSKLYHS